jgi:transcriptional regulator with XRE-family HTH domain
MAETEGDRLYHIRVALGVSPRRPESQPAFAERIGYDASTISRIERGELRMSREFAEKAAAVDPMKRGPAWLLYGIITIHGAPPDHIRENAERNPPVGEPINNNHPPITRKKKPPISQEDYERKEAEKKRGKTG